MCTALQLVEPTTSALTLQAGDNVTFTCIGDNAAVIAWYQSNRLVTLASGDVSLKFDRDYDANRQTALLTRAGVLGDATGDYQCRDQNHHIGNSRIIRLQVVAPVAEQSVNNSTYTDFHFELAYVPLDTSFRRRSSQPISSLVLHRFRASST